MNARRATYKASRVSLGIRKILYGNPHFYRGARGPAYGHLVFFPVLRYPPAPHLMKLQARRAQKLLYYRFLFALFSYIESMNAFRPVSKSLRFILTYFPYNRIHKVSLTITGPWLIDAGVSKLMQPCRNVRVSPLAFSFKL